MELAKRAERWWMYPMKPALVGNAALRTLNLSRYWLSEKLDGWRVLSITGGETNLWTRHKRKMRAPEAILGALEARGLPRGTVLDGEIWSPTQRGGWEQSDVPDCQVAFWDCVRIGTRDISSWPIEDRTRALRDLIGDPCERVRAMEDVEASLRGIEAVHRRAAEVHAAEDFRSGFLHGVVLKRKGSPRRDHPSQSKEHPDWLKVIFDGMKGWEPDG